jgi:hypothetical protein
MLSNYFYAEVRVAVTNGLKFVAINNIPLGENRRSRFNVKQAAQTAAALGRACGIFL